MKFLYFSLPKLTVALYSEPWIKALWNLILYLRWVVQGSHLNCRMRLSKLVGQSMQRVNRFLANSMGDFYLKFYERVKRQCPIFYCRILSFKTLIDFILVIMIYFVCNCCLNAIFKNTLKYFTFIIQQGQALSGCEPYVFRWPQQVCILFNTSKFISILRDLNVINVLILD